jgi:hypothetical protein
LRIFFVYLYSYNMYAHIVSYYEENKNDVHIYNDHFS